MSRYRVAFLTVAGQNWYDVSSFQEALRRAKAEQEAGARGVEILEERDHPPGTDEFTARVTANFVRVWP